MYPKLQYISQGVTQNEHLKNIQSVLDNGCKWVQLRMKNFSPCEVEKTATKVRIITSQYKAIFILNDDVLIAKNSDADGVHLGLKDTSISDARILLGNKKIIGGTANTFDDVVQRINETCDYIGLGPFKHTITKENLSPILGIDGYTKIISQLTDQQKKIPIYAIGGISVSDVMPIISANIYGVAVSGIITNATNKKQIINQFNDELYVTIKNCQ